MHRSPGSWAAGGRTRIVAPARIDGKPFASMQKHDAGRLLQFGHVDRDGLFEIVKPYHKIGGHLLSQRRI